MIIALVAASILIILLVRELMVVNRCLINETESQMVITRWGKEIVESISFLKSKLRHRFIEPLELREIHSQTVSEKVLEKGAGFISHKLGGSVIWLLLDNERYSASDPNLIDVSLLFYSSFQPYFSNGALQGTGKMLVKDMLSWSELSSKGIEVIVAEPFIHNSTRGLCIVGGAMPQLFGPERLEDIRKICEKLGRELASLQELYELTHSVNRLTNENAFAKEMVKHVSHDLRSPLHTLQLVLNTLSGNRSDEEMVAAGLRSCDAAQSVVDSLLDLTRDSISDIAIQTSEVLLSDIVREVLPMFKPLAALKGLTLHSIAEPGETVVTTDKRIVKRILTNIISNAIKYTQSGGVTVEIKNEGDSIALSIVDTGVGMSSEEINLLGISENRFKPNIASGMGIGFAATKKLIENIQGKIVIDSIPDKGTSVNLTFPRSICAPLAANI